MGLSSPYHFYVYAPNGSKLGELPDVDSYSFVVNLNDHGTLTFKYPKRGRNYNLITPPGTFEIAIEYQGSASTYVTNEGVSSRYIPVSMTHDVLDPEGMVEYQMVTWSALARKQLARQAGTITSDRTERVGNTTSARTIQQAVDYVAGNPAGRNRGRTFTVTNVGSNAATYVLQYDITATVDQCLKDWTGQGILEWIPRQRGIYYGHPATSSILNTDYSSTLKIEPRWLLSATVDYDYSGHITAGHAAWDGMTSANTWNDTAAANGSSIATPSDWGALEAAATVTQQSMGTQATTNLLHGLVSAYTYSIDLSATNYAFTLPLNNLYPGKYISVPIGGSWAALRLQQMTVRATRDGSLTADLVMGDPLKFSAARTAEAIAKLALGKKVVY